MTNFVDVLKEMRDHYQNNINTGVAIPYYPNLVEDSLGLMEATNKFLVADDSELADNPVQSKLNDLENQAKHLSINAASVIEEELKKTAKELKENGNSDSSQSTFKDKIRKLKEDTKKKMNAHIEQIYTEAEKIGNAFPVAQNLILAAAQKISELIDDLLTRLVNYFVKIVSDIVLWIKAAWDSIVSTFNNIKTWILNWF